jgi:hypothetical protein
MDYGVQKNIRVLVGQNWNKKRKKTKKCIKFFLVAFKENLEKESTIVIIISSHFH